MSYVRKTDTDRREKGGLECAVLMLVGDGFKTSFVIASILEISPDNANGALYRLQGRGFIVRARWGVANEWIIADAGRAALHDPQPNPVDEAPAEQGGEVSWEGFLKEGERQELERLDQQDAAVRIERRRIYQRCWKRQQKATRERSE